MQEFNSVEAIKSAVQYGLGAAFVSSAAISKEMDLGLFKRLDISGVRLTRTLSLVCFPLIFDMPFFSNHYTGNLKLLDVLIIMTFRRDVQKVGDLEHASPLHGTSHCSDKTIAERWSSL